MTTTDKILAAIDATFAASPAPPTSGDLAAAVLRALATECGWNDYELLEMAYHLDGALSQGEQRAAITDAELQDRFRAWWQQSYPTPPDPHAVMTHVSWARHLLELDKQRQS